MIKTLALLAAVAASSPALGADHAGRASVIDGDTIEIAGKRIRLWGVDAPESSQTCRKADGAAYRCGKDATFALDARLKGKVVSCVQKDVDQYHRSVAVCRVDREDVNGWLVENGHAVAYKYNRTYSAREADAKRRKAGVWQGAFVLPWDWRRGAR